MDAVSLPAHAALERESRTAIRMGSLAARWDWGTVFRGRRRGLGWSADSAMQINSELPDFVKGYSQNALGLPRSFTKKSTQI